LGVAVVPAQTLTGDGPPEPLQAGAAEVDISPQSFPVIIAGSFLERTSEHCHDPLFARAIVLKRGTTRLAIVVADTLMIPGELVEKARRLIERQTQIPGSHVLIGATHTHSAPALMGALGTRPDPYREQFPQWIAEAVTRAAERLEPAEIGWTVVAAPQHTHCRRWITRPDRMLQDPFGQLTVRAMMHPGYQNPNFIGPAGPVDTALSLMAIRSTEGRPIALLANYSMHYFGAPAVSADYFGRFSRLVSKQITPAGAEPCVVMMSQGTSGDLHWMDYSQPRKEITLESYAQEVADIACQAYQSLSYQGGVSLAAAESVLMLKRRTPDEARLAWARQMVAKMSSPKPQNIPEVYALEQIYLHESPQAQVRVQAMRIGELGLVAIPCEVFGITGLKIKNRSPFDTTVVFELANGAEGYIPPPEQHALGGYTTWPARTAGLEIEAEPKIVEAGLQLLEQLAGKPRRSAVEARGAFVEAILSHKPIAYWRMGDMDGCQLADEVAGLLPASLEPGYALYLEGADRPGITAGKQISRAVHFAGGRAVATIPSLEDCWSVTFWFWNGLPHDARAITGYLISRGPLGDPKAAGDHWGIGGTHRPEIQGRLFFFNGNEKEEILVGHTPLELKRWYFCVVVRDGQSVAAYLDGAPEPELAGRASWSIQPEVKTLVIAGRSDGLFPLEGKLDEVAVFNRALTPAEIGRIFQAAMNP